MTAYLYSLVQMIFENRIGLPPIRKKELPIITLINTNYIIQAFSGRISGIIKISRAVFNKGWKQESSRTSWMKAWQT